MRTLRGLPLTHEGIGLPTSCGNQRSNPRTELALSNLSLAEAVHPLTLNTSHSAQRQRQGRRGGGHAYLRKATRTPCRPALVRAAPALPRRPRAPPHARRSTPAPQSSAADAARLARRAGRAAGGSRIIIIITWPAPSRGLNKPPRASPPAARRGGGGRRRLHTWTRTPRAPAPRRFGRIRRRCEDACPPLRARPPRARRAAAAAGEGGVGGAGPSRSTVPSPPVLVRPIACRQRPLRGPAGAGGLQRVDRCCRAPAETAEDPH
eukprot:scaffold176_cov356-Prasinococcus_capsulatus_cf.AAC.8